MKFLSSWISKVWNGFRELIKPTATTTDGVEHFLVVLKENSLEQAWLHGAIAITVTFTGRLAEDLECIVVVVRPYRCVGYCSLFYERTHFHRFTITGSRYSNGIIDDFSWHSSGNGPAKVSVIMKICLIGLPATLVRITLTDFTMKPFHVKIVFSKTLSKIFKQLRIAWRICQTQVVWWFNDANIEIR